LKVNKEEFVCCIAKTFTVLNTRKSWPFVEKVVESEVESVGIICD